MACTAIGCDDACVLEPRGLDGRLRAAGYLRQDRR